MPGTRSVRIRPTGVCNDSPNGDGNGVERRVAVVRGTVQGVGFRPFVYGLARELGLAGVVRNDSGAVRIEVEGTRPRLAEFFDFLQDRAPPLARIEQIDWRPAAPRGERAFRIEASAASVGGEVCISPDVATCADCLAELFDPRDRRYKYPFINCTNCGPRLTIIRGAPYDRERTTMAGFAMCAACRREYEDPRDRRFHAQPVCCPACGPRLELCQPTGHAVETDDPLAEFVNVLMQGGIGALKGLGGYHLVCDARSSTAVAELRCRKHRDEKPLAVMVPSVEATEWLCHVSPHERELLASPRRPIVLLRRRKRVGDAVAEGVAPGNPYLGLMLPYAPLHHLLMDAVGGAPLVMTSGNRSDEPIAYLDDDAVSRLGAIADVILRHNRPIHVRCDDSVTRCVGGREQPVRRSRGYAPQPIKLPLRCQRPILSVGGQFKGVFALGVNDQAILSQHLGDLDHLEAYRQFERDIELYEQLFQAAPELIVHDLHPDYAATRYAQKRAGESGVALLVVQHHHAHMASCMAEHGLDEPVIGVTFDGTGLGMDTASGEPTVWGGEFLVGDYRQFRRAAHLRYVPMPGGDKAAREPWRMAAAHLTDAACRLAPLAPRIPAAKLRTVEAMLARRFNCPLTSSAGRLFDAVAAIAGVRDTISYEGQAAMELEWLATDAAPAEPYPFEICMSDATTPGVVDTRPIIRAVCDDASEGRDAVHIARRFHSTLVTMIVEVCSRLARQTGRNAVVLSGGVFQNALLTSEVEQALSRAGLRVYRHRLVPPGDGGLCLGQLAIAAAQF